MNNPQVAIQEMDHAINNMGAAGVQILTSVNGRALDNPEYFAVFERMANHHKMPIWMHPIRLAKKPDYAEEEKSKFEVWQVLGWPFETSVAMSRMVFLDSLIACQSSNSSLTIAVVCCLTLVEEQKPCGHKWVREVPMAMKPMS